MGLKTVDKLVQASKNSFERTVEVSPSENDKIALRRPKKKLLWDS